MTLKEVIERYIILSGHKGIENQSCKCKCDLSNIMYCMRPDCNCEIIEKGE
jgi:hypothetical protein